MPVYAYYCGENGRTVEVAHGMTVDLTTWAEVCERAEIDDDGTPGEAAVERILFAPGLAMPAGDAKLKELGFTKLVRRDKGVYENVTATGEEKRYMRSDDPTSVPHVHKKVRS